MFAPIDHENPCGSFLAPTLHTTYALERFLLQHYLAAFYVDIIDCSLEQVLENLRIASLHFALFQVVSRSFSQDTCHQSVLPLATLSFVEHLR